MSRHADPLLSSKTENMWPNSAAAPSPTSKPDLHNTPEDLPASELHASIKSALQLATENYFQSGAFAKAMKDSVHRVSTIQTTYRHNKENDHLGHEDEKASSDSTYSSANLIQSLQTGNKSRICYRTSATGVLFGTIWLRTTSVRVDSTSGKKGKTVDVVSSFTFFPSHWLMKLGLNCGMEANAFPTPTGWQFNFNPIRGVPDDSPIFSACRKGNLSAVRFLLTEGKASVRDTNSKGWTPLHVRSQTWYDCDFL